MNGLTEAALPHVQDAAVPAYDRSSPPSIVHLGVGAFARAHLAVYADDLMASGARAAIRGVSLRSDRAERALAPQDGLFTVTTREPSEPPTTQVVGSLTSVATGFEVAVEAITAPSTGLLTLTVTEHAYGDAGPGSVAFAVASGLERRRQAHGRPMVVASLDNLIDNGSVLERQVLVAAKAIGGGLDGWIAEHVRFPRSVVDRMVPATTDADLGEVARRIGVEDLAAVVAERYRSWTIEAVDGLPPLATVGVEVVDDIGPAQRRKLWLLNAPHSALAVGGMIAGHDVIATAVAEPVVGGLARRVVDDTLAVIDGRPEEAAAFAKTALGRFANPALGHRCDQVGADGSTKLPQRVLPVMALRRAAGLASPNHALVVAAWLAAVTSIPVAGAGLPRVADPMADRLRDAATTGGPSAAVRAFLPAVYQDLADEIVDAFDDLVRRGLDALGDPA